MCVEWKISRSHSCYVDSESIPLKMSFISISKSSSGTSTNPCFPLRRAYLFTFMLSHHPLIKSTSWRAQLSFAFITVNLYWCDYDWISFTMNYNVQSVLDLQGCSGFMFYGLRQGQRDTILLYHIMIVLRKCCHLRFIIIARKLIMPLI